MTGATANLDNLWEYDEEEAMEIGHTTAATNKPVEQTRAGSHVVKTTDDNMNENSAKTTEENTVLLVWK